ncbi:RNA polymerase sigma-70 factor [Sunxiuqinia sp. A32]|uniref:RNA polymerase sigma-70 factor n=1 Tax=Sunxiuqinia sp. A32 TaxID=3461496 RepID=UPI004046513B
MNLSQSEFKQIYFEYFKVLCLVSYRCINDMDKAQDIVQEVFMNLYENIDKKEISGEIFTYLKKAVFYKSIDLIKKEQAQNKYLESLRSEYHLIEMENLFDQAKLEQTIYEIVGSLPEQCQQIFLKSRQEKKTNKEIAIELNISVRTVESHIFKAIKKLKAGLKEHLTKIIFTFI